MATAARIADLAAESGWTLYELRHELPSLERVFLERTRDSSEARAAVSEQEAGA